MGQMSSASENDPVGQLQSILVGAENASEFLSGLSKLAAASVSEAVGDEIDCAVTVKVRRRPVTAAGSSKRAIELDQLEQAIGDGPCIKALREMSPVLIDDVSSDPQWPELSRKFLEANVHTLRVHTGRIRQGQRLCSSRAQHAAPLSAHRHSSKPGGGP
jgi:hypothetical protein